MRALSLATLLLGACATRLPEPPPPDLAGLDLTVTTASLVGIYTWQSDTATAKQSCDNGGTSNDPVNGNFRLTAGPGAGQVNIGAGTGACPVFIFDVAGGVATLTNLGVTCASGPGTMTTRGGSITTSDGGQSLTMQLVLDLMVPDGGGHFIHCVLTVAGPARRNP